MFIDTLDHYLVCTDRYEETIDFYTRILGLRFQPSEIGGTDAPSSEKWAAWLFDPSDRAIVHVVGLNEQSHQYVIENNLAHRRPEDTDPAYGLDHLFGSGAVDHMAFDCSNFEKALASFRENETPFRYFKTQRTGIHQLFVKDPNGIVLEFNFPRDNPPEDLVRDLPTGEISREGLTG